MPACRYAILHHTGHGEAHFDVMIEARSGGKLMTWRVAHWPIECAEPLVKLADHRRDYLEYEGPVSRGRGEVRRVSGGTLKIEPRTGDGDVLQLTLEDGTRLLLLCPPSHGWALEPAL